MLLLLQFDCIYRYSINSPLILFFNQKQNFPMINIIITNSNRYLLKCRFLINATSRPDKWNRTVSNLPRNPWVET